MRNAHVFRQTVSFPTRGYSEIRSRSPAPRDAAPRCHVTSHTLLTLFCTFRLSFFFSLILYVHSRARCCDPGCRGSAKGARRESGPATPSSTRGRGEARRGDSQRCLLPYSEAPSFPIPRSGGIARVLVYPRRRASFSRRARADSRELEIENDLRLRLRDTILTLDALDAPPRTRQRALESAGARTDKRTDGNEREKKTEGVMHIAGQDVKARPRLCVARLVHTRATASDAVEATASPIHAPLVTLRAFFLPRRPTIPNRASSCATLPGVRKVQKV